MKFKNEFFDSEDCEFEVLGFYETFNDARTRSFLGDRRISEPTRPLGSDGMLIYDLTEELLLRRGHKEFLLKASPKKPRRVMCMIRILCGRTKTKSQ